MHDELGNVDTSWILRGYFVFSSLDKLQRSYVSGLRATYMFPGRETHVSGGNNFRQEGKQAGPSPPDHLRRPISAGPSPPSFRYAFFSIFGGGA